MNDNLATVRPSVQVHLHVYVRNIWNLTLTMACEIVKLSQIGLNLQVMTENTHDS